VTAEDAGIGGGIRGTPDPSMPNHVTFYVEVPRPGGDTQGDRGPRRKDGDGAGGNKPGTTIAVFLDPHGDMVGLSKAE